MTTCNWCGASGDWNIVEYEGHGRLCGGCAYCVGHGAPRPIDDDKPFTAAQQRLEAFSTNFFDQISRLYPKPQGAI